MCFSQSKPHDKVHQFRTEESWETQTQVEVSPFLVCSRLMGRSSRGRDSPAMHNDMNQFITQHRCGRLWVVTVCCGTAGEELKNREKPMHGFLDPAS